MLNNLSRNQFFQFPLLLLPVRHFLLLKINEFPGMVMVKKVTDFMNNHILYASFWCFDEFLIKYDLAFWCATVEIPAQVTIEFRFELTSHK